FLIGHPSEAVAACEAAVRLKPDYADAYSNLGTALGNQGRLTEATAAFERRARARFQSRPELLQSALSRKLRSRHVARGARRTAPRLRTSARERRRVSPRDRPQSGPGVARGLCLARLPSALGRLFCRALAGRARPRRHRGHVLRRGQEAR